KVSGRRSYELARKGKAVELTPRWVHFDTIIAHYYEYPRLEIEVHCGKGTYIRALARDIGQRLGTGAILTLLRRTCVGQFRADQAVSLNADTDTATNRILPLIEAVRELPRVTLPDDSLARLCAGQGVQLSPAPVPDFDPIHLTRSSEIVAVNKAGELMAI